MVLFEAEGKIKGGGKTGLVGDLGEGLAGVPEEMAGLGKPLRFEIFAGRLADLTAKERGETRPGEAETARGVFQKMAFPQVAGEMIDGLLDARMPERIAGPGIGPVAKKERAFDTVKRQQFTVRQAGPQNGIGEDEFLEGGAAEFRRQA